MSARYAYGYVRVSTDKQEELSPDSQEKLLREYAAKNNIIILKVFFEIGISGRKADKRPEFQKMIGLAKSSDHPVDVILVWKFSRFARNQEESIVYKSLLRKQSNVDVVSVSEPLIDGPFGSLIERIIEWMDEYYSIRLSGEVLRGMKEKATKKGYQMSPPFGYRAVGNGDPYKIDPDEMKVVDFICDESCGKCAPCRIGTKRMLELLTDICEGRGTMETLDELENLGKMIKDTALCGLGQTAANPVLSTLRLFRDEYEAHVKEKRCPAGVCKKLLHYSIDPDKCRKCSMCARNCPVGAISGVPGQKPYVIDHDKCIKCGACMETCRFGAVKRD